MTAVALSRAYDTPALTRALVGSLTLDGRVEDALQLAELFAAIDIGTTGCEADALALDLAEALARRHSTSTLSRALVERVTLDGRLRDVGKLGLLLEAAKISTSEPKPGSGTQGVEPARIPPCGLLSASSRCRSADLYAETIDEGSQRA